MAERRKRKPKTTTAPHPVSPLPTMLVRLHTFRRGTTPTDFGLDAIFARRPRNRQEER